MGGCTFLYTDTSINVEVLNVKFYWIYIALVELTGYGENFKNDFLLRTIIYNFSSINLYTINSLLVSCTHYKLCHSIYYYWPNNKPQILETEKTETEVQTPPS